MMTLGFKGLRTYNTHLCIIVVVLQVELRDFVTDHCTSCEL